MTQQQRKMDFKDFRKSLLTSASFVRQNDFGKERTDRNNSRKKFRESAPFNRPNSFGKEGVDHINISIQSETHLGRIFDPAYIKVINYKHIGKFNSVMSLWYWIRSPDLDDTIRHLTGRKLKAYAEASGVFTRFVPNFKAIIAQATWIKIKSYPGILKEIKKLDPEIKLLSYHVVKSSGLRVATSYAALIIDIAELIIKAVKEDKEPDFTPFVDTKDKAGLAFLEGVLEKVMPAEVLDRMRAADVNEEDKSDTDEEDEYDHDPSEDYVENQSSEEVIPAETITPQTTDDKLANQ